MERAETFAREFEILCTYDECEKLVTDPTSSILPWFYAMSGICTKRFGLPGSLRIDGRY